MCVQGVEIYSEVQFGFVVTGYFMQITVKCEYSCSRYKNTSVVDVWAQVYITVEVQVL